MKKVKDLDWEGLKTFRAVAEFKTVRAAALDLGIHHSTVSRRIEQLEGDAGVLLFERRPDGYVLTGPGEDLLQATSDFAEKLEGVTRQIAGLDRNLKGLVSLTMPEPVAEIVFAPRLCEFADAYPELELNIDTSLEFLDVARREADIAIRMDNNPPQGLVGKRLFPFRHTVYAHPDYLSETGALSKPERGRLLRWDKDDGAYPEWSQNTEYARTPAWGYFPSIRLQMAAAEQKFGIAMLPCLMGDGSPHLVRATQRAPEDARDIWILTHNDLRHTARIRAVMGFAERVIRDLRAQVQGDI